MTRALLSATVALLIGATTAAAVPAPPVSLAQAKGSAKVAFAQVQKKTPGASASGVSRCTHPQHQTSLADCKGWVRLQTAKLCRLQVRIHDTSEGLIWVFRGASSCSTSRSLSGNPGTVY